MKLIRIDKNTKNKTEQLKLIISLYCVMGGVKLSDTEITILSYFILYKINENTKKLIFKSGLLKNDNSYKNLLSKFKKLGFIQKDEIKREHFVNTDAFGSPDDEVVAFSIKIDNR